MKRNSEKNNDAGLTGVFVLITSRAAMVSGIFSLLVATLLLVNYFQLKSVDPLNSPALTVLRKRMVDSPDDETLKIQVREVELLARRAFFTSQSQLRTGSFLLIGGIAVMLLSLNLLAFVRRQEPLIPDKSAVESDPFRQRMKAYRTLAGSVFFLLAILLFCRLMNLAGLPGTIPVQPVPLEVEHKSPDVEHSDGGNIERVADTDVGSESAMPSEQDFTLNWPSFRGLNGNGRTVRPAAPIHWDGKSGRNIRWKTEVPMPGFSSPIVWGKRVFLTGGNKIKRQVMAFDADSGRLLWRKDVCGIKGSPAKAPKVTSDTGYAAPTMVTDGQRVFAIFATGDLICFSLAGQRCWGINLGVPENHYGYSSSLMLYRNTLLVQFDHAAGSLLIGINTVDGRILWRKKRDGDISWASPIIVYSGTRTEIILVTSSLISSHSVENGRLFWSVNCMGGEVGSSPVYCDGVVFEANDNACAVAIDVVSGKILWKSDELDLPDVASPVVSGGYLFMATGSGLLNCVRARDGKLVWEKECEHGFYSSLILVGDNIYATDMSGRTYIFKAAQEYREVAVDELGAPVVTTPAFVGARIYLRSRKYLFCIESADNKPVDATRKKMGNNP